MAKIPVCLSDNRLVQTDGEIIHIWTVAPILDKALRPHWSIYAVRDLKHGIRIAVFKERQIAVNFAEYLWRNYGDITSTLDNSYNRAETPEDAAILDEINERANHTSRIKKSTHTNQYPGLFD